MTPTSQGLPDCTTLLHSTYHITAQNYTFMWNGVELGTQTSLFLFCGIKRITKLNWVEEKIDLQKKKNSAVSKNECNGVIFLPKERNCNWSKMVKELLSKYLFQPKQNS